MDIFILYFILEGWMHRENLGPLGKIYECENFFFIFIFVISPLK